MTLSQGHKYQRLKDTGIVMSVDRNGKPNSTIRTRFRRPSGPKRAPDDPHRLAAAFLQGHRSDDGRMLIRHWREEFLRWSDGAYRRVSDGTVRAELARVVGEMFEADAPFQVRAARAGGSDGKPPTVRKVTGDVISNTMTVLRSLYSGRSGMRCLRAGWPRLQEPPTPFGGWAYHSARIVAHRGTHPPTGVGGSRGAKNPDTYPESIATA